MHYPAAADNPLRTRADLQRLLLDLIAPLVPHFTPGRAGVQLGVMQPWYGEPAASLEGFARPLWGLLSFALGGGRCHLWPLWREGLINGTDPDHSEFWGWPADRDQRNVETPVIALAAALLPAEFWAPLSTAERARVAAWFSRINAVAMVDNNWLFFRVITNLALRHLGEAWSPEIVEADLRRLDEFYLGDGWYSDGGGRRGDYYVPMAFHYYGLIFSRLAGPAETAKWGEKFCARARRFALDFQHWFAADGEAIPFGRSLTYRCAQGAFWGALAFAGEESLPWGVMKGLYLRHLHWWIRQPIFSETGLLSVGYRYPNLLMAENYNGPGSPYWAFKAFLPLALDAAHPFWRAEEAPPPPRRLVVSAPMAGLVISSDAAGKLVVALNAGQPVTDYPRHAAEKYSKFAYATHFGFGVPAGGSATLGGGGFDSVLALSEDGMHFRARDTCSEIRVTGAVVSALWRPWPEVEVHTWLIPVGTVHVRVHRLKTSRPLWSSDAGFALGYRAPSALISVEPEPSALLLQSSAGTSALRDLTRDRIAETVFCEPNTNLIQPLTAMPVLRAAHAPGESWLVCVVGAWPEPDACFHTKLQPFAVEFYGAALHVIHAGQVVFVGPENGTYVQGVAAK